MISGFRLTLITLLIATWLLVACTPGIPNAPGANPPATSTGVEPSSATTSQPAFTPLPSATRLFQTEEPSSPTLSTPTLQAPSPTLETFTFTPAQGQSQTPTPTLDPWSVRTATPAPPAECPVVETAPAETPNFFDTRYRSSDVERDVLGYLDAYGPAPLEAIYRNLAGKDQNLPFFALQDLTNDGIPEVILGIQSFYIFGCWGGSYLTLLQLPPDAQSTTPTIVGIEDGNRNGIPEIILMTDRDAMGRSTYRVFEWNESHFQNILVSDDPSLPEDGKIMLISPDARVIYRDVDGDGLKELLAVEGTPVGEVFAEALPWRKETRIYKWNGGQYVFIRRSFGPPVYRFQAVQDADRAFLAGEFSEALNLYQQVIYNGELEWWSPERRKYLQESYLGFPADRPTPVPPQADPDEYGDLAAYARYRMIVLYASRGKAEDAALVYASIKELYQAGKPGYFYAELARAFWEDYAQSHNPAQACTRATGYAAAFPDQVLAPVGGDFHGGQSKVYRPMDICPIK